MKEGFRRQNRQESPSLVNGGGFRSHSKTVRRFESCLLHHIPNRDFLSDFAEQ